MSEPADGRKRRITGRLVRPGGDLDAFDAEFWQSMTGEERVDALWDMVLDSMTIKGNDLDEEPRLQRTVGRIMRP